MTNRWTYDTTVKFIQLYKSHECLWNFSSANYKNKHMRDAALVDITNEMCIQNFGRTDVKNKIKNLRSTYSQEKKKIDDSKKSGAGLNKVYVSNIKWLNELEEVFGKELRRKTYENIESPSDATEMEIELNTNTTQGSSSEATRADNSTGSTPRPKKRSKDILQAVNTLCSMQDKLENDENETQFSAFGKSVQKQLEGLSMENALLAQQKIQSVLTELGIKDYREKNLNKTAMTHYSYQSVPPPSIHSNYTYSDDNLYNAENYECSLEEFIQEEEIITSDNNKEAGVFNN